MDKYPYNANIVKIYETFIFIPRKMFISDRYTFLKTVYVIDVAGTKFYEDDAGKAFILYLALNKTAESMHIGDPIWAGQYRLKNLSKPSA